MLCRLSWPPDLQAKEQQQLKMWLEGPKSSMHEDGASCLALLVSSENLSMLCRSQPVGLQPDQTLRQLQIVCPVFVSLLLLVCLFAACSASPFLM